MRLPTKHMPSLLPREVALRTYANCFILSGLCFILRRRAARFLTSRVESLHEHHRACGRRVVVKNAFVRAKPECSKCCCY